MNYYINKVTLHQQLSFFDYIFRRKTGDRRKIKNAYLVYAGVF